MSKTALDKVAVSILRRAERQSFVVPREIREELVQAGMAETLWKNVVALIRPSLRYRQGRYYYVSTVTTRMEAHMRQQQEHQRTIQGAVRKVIRHYKGEAKENERRQYRRVQFVKTVTLLTEDRRELRVLTRDISLLGIRLIGTCSLLGQKLRLWLTESSDSPEPRGFLVHILWSNAVADHLFENGGIFLEVLSDGPDEFKLVGESH